MSKTFERAVGEVDAIRDAFRPGLQALQRSDRSRIDCKDPRSLRGSLDLDGTLKGSLPDEPRWDYGIGVWGDAKNDRIVWVEVHPASSNHVDEVIRKYGWLRKWLSEFAPALDEFKAEYVWVASGKVTITRGSPQRRKVAQRGIRFAGERLEF